MPAKCCTPILAVAQETWRDIDALLELVIGPLMGKAFRILENIEPDIQLINGDDRSGSSIVVRVECVGDQSELLESRWTTFAIVTHNHRLRTVATSNLTNLRHVLIVDPWNYRKSTYLWKALKEKNAQFVLLYLAHRKRHRDTRTPIRKRYHFF